MTSIHLGKNLVGQRVTDLLTLVDFAGKDNSMENAPVDLYASGASAPVAIYAALFRPRIQSIYASKSIQTYFDVLHYPMEVDWYSYVIPNVLAYFDLPDLLKLRDDLDVTWQGEKSRIKDHSKNKYRTIR